MQEGDLTEKSMLRMRYPFFRLGKDSADTFNIGKDQISDIGMLNIPTWLNLANISPDGTKRNVRYG
jgi:hypothetical protein